MTAPDRPPLTPLHVIQGLRKRYPPFVTALSWKDEWQLLVAVILSAQCTDERVNRVTPALFKALPTVQDFSTVPQTKLEKLIFSTGFYRSKAKNIQAAANAIIKHHGGAVPSTMAELVAIPGVGRKTANVFLHAVHKKAEGIVVDTHIYRVSRRTGAARGDTPEQVERDLMTRLPRRYWIEYGNLTIQHGRAVCHARKPNCAECPLKRRCPSSIATASRATRAARR
jgi:endonuclease-3